MEELESHISNIAKGLRYTASEATKLAEKIESGVWNLQEKEIKTNIIIPKFTPPKTIQLPMENNTSLNKFYGTATKNGNNLVWFKWPKGCEARLYTRSGALLPDRFENDDMVEHRCHKLIKDRLENCLNQLWHDLGKDRFYKEGHHVYSGCFNYRFKKSGGSLSTHSWGIAIDINGEENGFYKKTTTFSNESLDIWENWGFLNAGRAWVNTPDFMHRQAAIIHVSKGSYYDKNGLPENIKIWT